MSVRERWEQELDDVKAGLAGQLIEVDGRQFFDPNGVPPGLVALYRGLVSVGYARGWIA